MPNIEELLQLAAEGDEDAQKAIKDAFSTKEREAATAKRDLKLRTDSTLRDRYPRALRAWDKGKLKLSDDMTDDDLLDALKDKEEEYAELGVPVETSTPAKAETKTEPAAEGEAVEETDPAKALSGGRGASGPGGSPRDMVAEYFDALKGSTTHDQAKANGILVELNKTGQRDKIAYISEQLSARPIINM